MDISSQDLSTLTLLASGVPSETVKVTLGPDAERVKNFLLNPAQPVTTPEEQAALETAVSIKRWFEQQRADSRQRATSTFSGTIPRADSDWDSLLSQ